MRCVPGGSFPVSKANCESFASTGVTLERTWQATNDNQVSLMRNVWRSADGAPHSLSTLYFQELQSPKTGGAFEFPGSSSFQQTTKGQQFTLPAGPGQILNKSSAATPDGGDCMQPQGAIVYDTAPSGPVAFGVGSEGSEWCTSEMPYQRTITASNPFALRMAFVRANALSEVRSLAEAASATYPPSVAITSPASGASLQAASPAVTVSGTASDTGALASLTVNGQPVAVGAGGAWSTSVNLSVGPNTITAVATDQAGLSAKASIGLTYSLPPVPTTAAAATIALTTSDRSSGAITYGGIV